MEFLRNVVTNFIYEKLLSYEAPVTERVTSISNNLHEQSNAKSYGIIERNCSCDV